MSANIEVSTSLEFQNICHVVTTHDLLQGVENNEYMAILKKLTHTNLMARAEGNILKWNGDISELSSFEKIIKTCKSFNFDYIVVWFEGNTMYDDFESTFLNWARYRTQDWTMMGHILDREHRCPTLHNQIVIFNLKRIDEDFDIEYLDEDYSDFVASDKHIHDDYTPLWLKAKPGITDKPYKPKHVIDNIMWNLLSQGHTVVNVPEELREQKHCVYPEEDEQETVEWLLNENLKNYTLEQVYDLEDEVGFDKSILTEHLLAKDVVYVTNTDNVIKDCKLNNIETIICPASGFNQFMYAFKNIDTIEKMIWTDFSESALWWTKHILQNFDGNSFEDFWFKNRQLLELNMNEYRLIECDYDKLKDIDRFLAEQDSSSWDKIVKLEHVFLNIDIINDYDKILQNVKDSNVFIQATNIYSYEVNYFNNKYLKVYQSFYDLLHKLTKTNKNVYFHGESPNGIRYRDFTNLSRTAF